MAVVVLPSVWTRVSTQRWRHDRVEAVPAAPVALVLGARVYRSRREFDDMSTKS